MLLLYHYYLSAGVNYGCIVAMVKLHRIHCNELVNSEALEQQSLKFEHQL
jgi:hypothetical protein